MAKLVASDLATVESFADNILSNEAADIENLKSSINEFIATSQTELTGEAWDRARSNLNNYLEVLELRKQCAQAISDAIKSANGIMNNYMSDPLLPDGVADDSRLEEITRQLNSATANLNDVEYKIKNLSSSEESQKQNLQSAAISYGNTISKLKPIYDKLKQLSPTDINASGNYEQAISAISEFQSAVGSIETSNVTV